MWYDVYNLNKLQFWRTTILTLDFYSTIWPSPISLVLPSMQPSLKLKLNHVSIGLFGVHLSNTFIFCWLIYICTNQDHGFSIMMLLFHNEKRLNQTNTTFLQKRYNLCIYMRIDQQTIFYKFWLLTFNLGKLLCLLKHVSAEAQFQNN